MDNLQALKKQVADHLRGGGLSAAKIFAAYPAAQREFPLKKPVVAVGLEELELTPTGLGGYWGDTPQGADSLYGGSARITLRFDLYCPGGEGAEGCYSLYEGLCQRLMPGENPFGVFKVSCGETVWDKSAAAHHLRAFATLRAAFTRRDESAELKEFLVIRTGGETLTEEV